MQQPKPRNLHTNQARFAEHVERARSPADRSDAARSIEGRNPGGLLVQAIATDAVRLLRPLVARVQRHDKSLADQLRRAASSVVLNLAEAAYNNAGHRRSRLESARGSANETRAALAVAAAWGYVDEAQVREVDALYHRVLAMTYPLWARA